MQALVEKILDWRKEGIAIALATILSTWGSSPRPPGSRMAINALGQNIGSVSGGCVESAVIQHALEVLASGVPRQIHFGVADDTAWSVGLACGGEIDLWIETLDSLTESLLVESISLQEPKILICVLKSGDLPPGWKTSFTLRGNELESLQDKDILKFISEDILKQKGTECVQTGTPAGYSTTTQGSTKDRFVFLPFLPPYKLIIIGGGHIAVALSNMARLLDYQVIIIDPRRAFASPEMYPYADQVLHAWPEKILNDLSLNATTAVAVLSHDPKIDDPSIQIALEHPVFYIGALGSKRTHSLRIQRLMSNGVPEDSLKRVQSPIGLPLGGRSAEEIALSILAQITTFRYNPVKEN